MALILFQRPDMANAEKGGEPPAKPDRLITMAVEYPGVKIARDVDEVSMDIIFHNKGKSDENVNLWIAQKPPAWEARIKTYRYAITGVHVPSGDNKSVTFEVEAAENVQPGKYNFLIKAQTPDDAFQMSQQVSIEILGFGARTIAIVDTMADSPLGQVAMIPMLAWIAQEAPKDQKATYFAVMAAFTNLALSASQLGTKYLNKIFVVERGQYDELGMLMASVAVIGLIVPVATVLLVNPASKHTRQS